jgi:glycosyltransferase involved in cell wall biosynthesis
MHDIFDRKSTPGRAIRFLAPLLTHVIAVSEAVRQSLISNGMPAGKITVVHNGLDAIEKFNPNHYSQGYLRNKFAVPQPSILVGVIGVLIEWKGFHLFVEVVRKLDASTRRKAAFFIIGDSWPGVEECKRQLISQIDQAGLANTIYLTGRLANIPEILADLDVVVHTSLRPDPLPNVLLESMAMAKIIIASAGGGVTELVEDGVSGIVIKPGDVNSLANHLTAIIEETNRFRQLGERARQRALQEFSVGRQHAEMLSIYERAINLPAGTFALAGTETGNRPLAS